MNPLVLAAQERFQVSPETIDPEHRPRDRCHLCFGCQKEYDDLITLDKIKSFSPSCNLSPDIRLRQETEDAELDDFEQMSLSLAWNPVEWAKVELGWTARWYQEEILCCSSKFKVIRCGRRVGKTASLAVDCLHKAYTRQDFKILIVTPYQEQSDLIFNDYILPMIDKSVTMKSMVTRYVKAPSQNLEFSNGSRIKAMTSGTKTGSKAAKVRGQDAHHLALDECLVAGTLINVTAASVKPIEKLSLSDTIWTYNTNEKKYELDKIVAVKCTGKHPIRSLSTPISRILVTDNHPIFDGEKYVPAKDARKALVSLNYRKYSQGFNRTLARLVGVLFGDGWITVKNSTGFSGQELDLEQVREDLSRLGVGFSHANKISTVLGGSKDRGIYGSTSSISYNSLASKLLLSKFICHGRRVSQEQHVPEFVLRGSKSIQREFLAGFFGAELSKLSFVKGSNVLKAPELRMRGTNEKFLFQFMEEVRLLTEKQGIKTNGPTKITPIEDKLQGTWRIRTSKNNILRFVKRVGYAYNQKGIKRCNLWLLYRKYKKTHAQPTWRKNREVLLCKLAGLSRKQTSQKLDLAISTVKFHWNKDHPIYSKAFIKDIFEFYRSIEHSNGKVLVDLNLESNSDYGIRRVFNLETEKNHTYFANGVLTHNCDYLSSDDIEAILAITLSHPDVSVWASSTPTGKREHFYRWVNSKDQLFKSFHFPSSVSPVWTPEIEKWKRSSNSEAAYIAEYEADFPVLKEGVFPAYLVDRAIKDYDPERTGPQEGWLYGIGVDWNDVSTGTNICIVGFSPTDFKFWFIKKHIISREQYTQLSAVEKIIELNEYWNPSFIYCDLGYGNTQQELIRKYGSENPSSKLLQRVKAIDMGSKTVIQDPFLGEVKKYTKPFIVGLAVRRFEQDQVLLPKCEYKREGTEGLVDQMFAYKVERYTAEGRPVYSAEHDHMLTAWMLAIYGFWMEHTDIAAPTNVTRIAIVNSGQGSESKREDLSALPFPTITFEFDAEDIKKERENKRKSLLGRSRGFDIPYSNGNFSDIKVLQRQRQKSNTSRLGFSSGKKPFRRQGF